MKKNLLSLAINGRNDQYNPYFLERLKYQIEYTIYTQKKLSLNNFIRFTICDWGSDYPLSKALNLSKNYSKYIDFIKIDKVTANHNSHKKDRYYSVSLAHNVAIRRSKGKFIAQSAHDTFFSESSLLNLYHFLNGKMYSHINLQKMFLWVHRIKLPEKLFEKKPSYDFLTRWLSHSGHIETDVGVKHGGAAGAHIASKDLWFKIRGLDESYSSWGLSEFDLFVRSNLDSMWYDSSNFGIHIFKIPRGSSNVRNAVIAKNVNRKKFTFKLHSNESNWGLGNKKIKIEKLEKQNKFTNEVHPLVKFSRTKLDFIFYIKGFFKIITLKVPLRFKIISLSEIYFIIITLRILQSNLYRSVAILGYKDILLPSFISTFNNSLELHILDDVENIIKRETKKKLDGSIVWNRSILLSEVLGKIGPCLNHLGLLKIINGNLKKNISNFINNLPKLKFENLIIIRQELFNDQELERIYNYILKNKDLFLKIIVFRNSKSTDKKIFKLSKFYNFYETNYVTVFYLIDKKYQNKKITVKNGIQTFIKSLIFFSGFNILYYAYYFYRFLKNRVLKRIFYVKNLD